ncbi:MAG: YggS family pyridoxal phosphate-dependent enzyme [Marinilabiliales bacterium]|nr:MAG: YggS family pyridoxal phosphate-dependent enzyme [Marinilabiliales bacterium]
MSVAENLSNLIGTLPGNVKLVAVSKTKPVEMIMEAYNIGYKVFGENKVQDLVSKYEEMPKDIEWHFIGHLQSNKVKYIAPFVSMIHSVDSLKLAKIINKEAIKNNRIIPCLLQMHIAEEDTKFGFSQEELFQSLENNDFQQLQNLKICGVMGMATFTENNNQVRREFASLAKSFNEIKNKFFSNSETGFTEISMGMSGDYQIAIEEGSTIIRVGSSIFGARN